MYNTWEPKSNLQGCEELLDDFQRERRGEFEDEFDSDCYDDHD